MQGGSRPWPLARVSSEARDRSPSRYRLGCSSARPLSARSRQRRYRLVSWDALRLSFCHAEGAAVDVPAFPSRPLPRKHRYNSILWLLPSSRSIPGVAWKDGLRQPDGLSSGSDEIAHPQINRVSCPVPAWSAVTITQMCVKAPLKLVSRHRQTGLLTLGRNLNVSISFFIQNIDDFSSFVHLPRRRKLGCITSVSLNISTLSESTPP